MNVTIDKSIYFFKTKNEKEKKEKEEDAFRGNSKHFTLAALGSWFDNYHFSREHFRSNPFYSVCRGWIDRCRGAGMEGMSDKTRRQTFRRIFTARIFIHLLVLGSPSRLTNGNSNFRIFFNGTRTTSICRKQVAPIFLSASNWSILFLPFYCLFFFFFVFLFSIHSLSLSLFLSLLLPRPVRLIK